MNALNRPIVFWDCETTGLSPQDSRVVEIGALKIDPDGKTYEYQQLLNPGFDTTGLEAMEINKIAQSELNQAPLFSDVVKVFSNFVADAGIMVAHNAQFDVDFLAVEFQRARAHLPKVPVVCTKKMAQNVLNFQKGFGLQSLRNTLFPNNTYGTAHRAMADVKVMADLFFLLMNRAAQGGPLTVDTALKTGRSDRQFSDHQFHPTMMQGNIMEALTKEAASVTYTDKNTQKLLRGRPAGYLKSSRDTIVFDVNGKPTGVQLSQIENIVSA